MAAARRPAPSPDRQVLRDRLECQGFLDLLDLLGQLALLVPPAQLVLLDLLDPLALKAALGLLAIPALLVLLGPPVPLALKAALGLPAILVLLA